MSRSGGGPLSPLSVSGLPDTPYHPSHTQGPRVHHQQHHISQHVPTDSSEHRLLVEPCHQVDPSSHPHSEEREDYDDDDKANDGQDLGPLWQTTAEPDV